MILYACVLILVLQTASSAKTWDPVRTPLACIYTDTWTEREVTSMRMCNDPPNWLLGMQASAIAIQMLEKLMRLITEYLEELEETPPAEH
jgi:hypothetical protein